MDDNQYIITDSKVAFGKPCIVGTRISVEFILERFSLGATIDYMLDQYPQITQEQVFAALRFTSVCLRSDYDQRAVA